MKKWLHIFFIAAMLASCSSKKQVTSTVNEPRRITSDEVITTSDSQIRELIEEARKWIGTPYVYGGQSRSGTDCSGMVMEVFKSVYNIKLPRSAAMQQNYAQEIDRNDLSAGDLVFFNTGKSKNRVNHVGLYIGDGRMIHASSSRGVMESGINENYWQRAYFSSGRVLQAKKQPKQSKSKKTQPAPTPEISAEKLQELYDALDQTLDSIYVSDPAIFD